MFGTGPPASVNFPTYLHRDVYLTSNLDQINGLKMYVQGIVRLWLLHLVSLGLAGIISAQGGYTYPRPDQPLLPGIPSENSATIPEDQYSGSSPGTYPDSAPSGRPSTPTRPTASSGFTGPNSLTGVGGPNGPTSPGSSPGYPGKPGSDYPSSRPGIDYPNHHPSGAQQPNPLSTGTGYPEASQTASTGYRRERPSIPFPVLSGTGIPTGPGSPGQFGSVGGSRRPGTNVGALGDPGRPGGPESPGGSGVRAHPGDLSSPEGPPRFGGPGSPGGAERPSSLSAPGSPGGTGRPGGFGGSGSSGGVGRLEGYGTPGNVGGAERPGNFATQASSAGATRSGGLRSPTVPNSQPGLGGTGRPAVPGSTIGRPGGFPSVVDGRPSFAGPSNTYLGPTSKPQSSGIVYPSGSPGTERPGIGHLGPGESYLTPHQTSRPSTSFGTGDGYPGSRQRPETVPRPQGPSDGNPGQRPGSRPGFQEPSSGDSESTQKPDRGFPSQRPSTGYPGSEAAGYPNSGRPGSAGQPGRYPGDSGRPAGSTGVQSQFSGRPASESGSQGQLGGYPTGVQRPFGSSSSQEQPSGYPAGRPSSPGQTGGYPSGGQRLGSSPGLQSQSSGYPAGGPGLQGRPAGYPTIDQRPAGPGLQGQPGRYPGSGEGPASDSGPQKQPGGYLGPGTGAVNGPQGQSRYPGAGTSGTTGAQTPRYPGDGRAPSGVGSGFPSSSQNVGSIPGGEGLSGFPDTAGGTYEGEGTPDEGDYSAIPGEPGRDYPIYADVPETSFQCDSQQFPGYYADVEAQCQVFHICVNNKTYDFLCPNGTIFHQQFFVCVWWNQFDCNSAQNFYYLNENLYDYSITGSSGFPGPMVDEQGKPIGFPGQPQGPLGLPESSFPGRGPSAQSRPDTFSRYPTGQDPSEPEKPGYSPTGPIVPSGSFSQSGRPSGRPPTGPSTGPSVEPSVGSFRPTTPAGSYGPPRMPLRPGSPGYPKGPEGSSGPSGRPISYKPQAASHGFYGREPSGTPDSRRPSGPGRSDGTASGEPGRYPSTRPGTTTGPSKPNREYLPPRNE